MDRLAFLVGHMDWTAAAALEIGALDRPVLAPGSTDVRYLDHLGTEDLRGKYRNDPAVDTDALVAVDYVWQGGPMSSAVADGRRFDLLVASHVFEHIADPVSWLLDARKLLRDDGRIFLVLPDRRFTFDIKRRDTTLSDWVGWRLRRLSKPSPDQVFDHFAHASAVPAERAWRGEDESGFAPMYAIGVAYDHARSVAEGDRYVDVHCSVFTPHRFVGLCRQLHSLDLFPYRIEAFRPTQANGIEFMVLLQATSDSPAPIIDRARLQDIGRQAGYAGPFRDGLFRLALDRDPGLKARYDTAMAAAQAAEAARVDGDAGRFPQLDPVIHHDRPRPGDAQD